ncbi:MAG TPA: hypothetical protein VKT75_10435 [Acidobacteriaceae bacterium]|nr:hypothetical protein [Acidobacteriaceae bacterium]
MRRHIGMWRSCHGHRPRLRQSYTPQEQSHREADAEKFVRVAEKSIASGVRDAESAVLQAFTVFARAALDLDDAHLKLLVGGFPYLAKGLAEQARRFDPALSATDIFQASRNVWTAAGLQVLLGQPLQLTPAIFAYSMLYPYTDNLLDDPHAPAEAKCAFNRRLRSRLQGESPEPADHRESKVWDLVDTIEGQYDRARHPEVYRSLLAIQNAQEESVGLRREAGLPSDKVLYGVFAKGGASVLADGYLAAGLLTPAQEDFAFGWGVLLQLADDLQDVAEDLAAGTATLFSDTSSEPLDVVTNRVFEFAECVFERLDAFNGPGIEPLKQLIRQSAAILLITAAGAAHELHSRAYIQELERHSPFRFEFVREHRQYFYGSSGLVGRCVAALA